MAAVFYQPLNFHFWYDKPSRYANPAGWPGLPWSNAVPTTWDESRTLAGSIGEYIAVARRGGSTWYLRGYDQRNGPNAVHPPEPPRVS